MSSCKEPTPWADRWAAVEAHCADMRDEGQLLMVEELLETLVESQRFSAASHTLQDRIEQLVLLEAGGWEVVNKDGGTDMLEALRDAQEMLSSREEEIEALHGYCKQHLLMTRLYKQVKADMANICERLQSLPCSPNGGMCATEEERFLRPQWLVQRVGETLTVQATALENLRAANDEFQKEVDRAEKAYKVLQEQLTSERASWRECLTKLEADVRQLQTENGELHSNGERLCTANERMEAELAALQQELATLGATKEEAAASYQQRVADLEDAGQQLRADAEAQLLRSAAEAAELEERLSELLVQKAMDVTTLQGEIARLEAEADRLQREHAEASQAAAQEAADLRQQLERLREEEREMWRHLEVATAQRDRSEEEAVKLQDRCEQLEQKLTTQAAERTQLQAELQALKEAKTAAMSEAADLTDRLAVAQREAEVAAAQRDRAKAEAAHLRDVMEKTETQLTDNSEAQKTKEAALLAELDTLRSQYEAATSAQQAITAEAEDLGRRLRQLGEEASRTQQECEELTRTKEQREAEVVALQGRLCEVEMKMVTDAEEKRTFKNQLKVLTLERTALLGDLQKAEAVLNEARRSSNREIARLEADLVRHQAEAAKLRESCTAFETSAGTLKAQLAQLLGDYEDLRQRKHSATLNLVEEATTEVAELKAQLSQAQREAKGQAARLETEKKALEDQLQALQVACAAVTERCEAATKEAASRAAEGQSLRQEVHSLQATLEDVRVLLEQSKTEVALLREQATKADAQRDAELAAHQRLVAKLEEEVGALRLKCDTLDGERRSSAAEGLDVRDRAQRLELDAERCRQQLEGVAAQRDTSEAEAQRLKSSLNHAEAEAETLRGTQQRLQAEVARLGQALFTAEHAAGQAAQELGAAEGRGAALLKESSALRLELETVRGQRDRLEGEASQLRETLSRMTAEVHSLRIEATRLEVELAAAREMQRAASAERQSTAGEASALGGRLEGLARELSALQHEAGATKAERDRFQAEAADLRQRLTQMETQMTITMQELQADKARLGAELADAQLTHKAQGQRQSALEEALGLEVQKLRQDLVQLAVEKGRAEAEASELRLRLSHEEEQATGDRQALRADKERAEELLADAKHSHTAAEREHSAAAEALRQEAALLRHQLERTVDERARWERECTELRQQLSDVESCSASTIRQLEGSNASLEADLVQAQQRYDATQEETLVASKQLADLQQQVEASLRQEVEKLFGEKDCLAAEVANLQKQLSDAKSELSTAAQERERLDGELAEVKRHYEAAERERQTIASAASQEWEVLGVEATALRQQLEQAAAEKASAEGELHVLETKLRVLEHQLQNQTTRFQEMTVQLTTGETEERVKAFEEVLQQQFEEKTFEILKATAGRVMSMEAELRSAVTERKRLTKLVSRLEGEREMQRLQRVADDRELVFLRQQKVEWLARETELAAASRQLQHKADELEDRCQRLHALREEAVAALQRRCARGRSVADALKEALAKAKDDAAAAKALAAADDRVQAFIRDVAEDAVLYEDDLLEDNSRTLSPTRRAPLAGLAPTVVAKPAAAPQWSPPATQWSAGAPWSAPVLDWAARNPLSPATPVTAVTPAAPASPYDDDDVPDARDVEGAVYFTDWI